MQEKWISVFIPNDCNSDDIRSWVIENVTSKYHFKPGGFDPLVGWCGQPSIKFEDPTDAVAFKLMWL